MIGGILMGYAPFHVEVCRFYANRVTTFKP